MTQVRAPRERLYPKGTKWILFVSLSVILMAAAVVVALPARTAVALSFIASIDTMKVSRDTQTRPLSSSEIAEIVQLSAQLHVNYITVDTNWDYPDYMQQWADVVHNAGLHAWFRGHPNQWENNNGASGLMTPAEYAEVEKQFILNHPTLFHSGDIFDASSEPEQGNYWPATYGKQWTSHAPNTATRDYNAFIRNTTDVADSAFRQIGITGVTTTVRSINSFFASHADVLEQSTVNRLGQITVDSYPEKDTTDPAVAAQARVSELASIENLWHVPIVVGEMGYSNTIDVNDATQQAVLKAEFDAMRPLPYIAGVNYWVGAGSNHAGGFTYIFKKTDNLWSPRLAAQELSAFYQAKLLEVPTPPPPCAWFVSFALHKPC